MKRRKFYSFYVRAAIDRDTMEWTTKFPRSKPCTPGEKPQRIFEDLQGSLKTCKDLQKIFEDEDLSRILKGSLKDL